MINTLYYSFVAIPILLICRRVSEIIGDARDDQADPDKRMAFSAIRQELSEAMDSVHDNLGKEWEDRFMIEDDAGKDQVRTVTMRLAVGNDKKTKRLSNGDLVKAMQLADLLDYRAGRFAAKFLDLVLKPLTKFSVTASEVKEEEGVVTMVIKWEVSCT